MYARRTEDSGKRSERWGYSRIKKISKTRVIEEFGKVVACVKSYKRKIN